MNQLLHDQDHLQEDPRSPLSDTFDQGFSILRLCLLKGQETLVFGKLGRDVSMYVRSSQIFHLEARPLFVSVLEYRPRAARHTRLDMGPFQEVSNEIDQFIVIPIELVQAIN